MAVNVIAGKNIESAIAANEAMVADSANFKQSEVMPERETKETLMADLKEGNTGKLGLRVLRQLVQGLSSAGIDLAKDKMVKKAGNKVKDEYDLMLERGEEGGDKIDIKDSRYFVQQTKAKNQDRQGGGSGDQSQQNLSPEAKEAVKQYVETYSSFLANGSAELKKKVETLEAKLSEKGLSAKDLLSLQANVRKSLRSEVLTQVKDSYINRLFVNKEKSLEFVMADRGIDEALSYAASNQRLGGEDFGGYRAGLEEALKGMAADTKQEVREHVGEEVLRKLVEISLTKKEDEKSLRELWKLGEKVGFDIDAFLKHWKEQRHDLGLVPVNIPNQSTASDSGSQHKNQEKTEEEIARAEDRDLLSSQLRAIYLQRAVKGDWMTVLQTSFRMRKLKNGLIKLGLNLEYFKRIESEGREVAIQRFKEGMLTEVLAERATLYDLSGPAYKLIETRLKGILSNLERLGSPLSKEELDLAIEKTDVRMHDLAMEELFMVQERLKAGSDPAMEKRQSQLVKLITRLREEAHINGPAVAQMQVNNKT